MRKIWTIDGRCNNPRPLTKAVKRDWRMSDSALIAGENRRYKQPGLLLLGFEKHNNPKMGVDRDYAGLESALLSPFSHSERSCVCSVQTALLWP